MARLVLYALAALARAYDWTTPGQALTALTATPTNDAGNLAVHPRTHKTVLSLARRSEHRIRDLHYAKHDFGSAPLQLRFAVGDVARARAGIDFLRCVCDL